MKLGIERLVEDPALLGRLKGRRVALLHPEKRIYTVQNMPMTEAAINRGVTRDLYVALGEALTPTTWIVRVWYKPFVNWIWIGCVIMAIGGLLARPGRVAPSRLRRSSHAPSPRRASRSPATPPTPSTRSRDRA